MAIPVKINVFEGPLDLLLHLIEKNKIDIYDIPIVEITDQYMEYLHSMEQILSGHYHGGVLRLDQNHGLTCPQYLLFPPFCCGEFKKGKQHMIVSAGLGEHTIPVRIHNPRELVLINLYPQSTKSVKEH